MGKKSTNAELEALRAELAQLKREREEQDALQAQQAEEAEKVRQAQVNAPTTATREAPESGPGPDAPSEALLGDAVAAGLPRDLSEWVAGVATDDVDAQALLDTVKANVGNYLEGFNEDLRDTKPSTLLLIFSLGVMVGRMTN